MSAMGFLEKLLGGAEVEWEPLADLTQPTANIKWSEADGVYRYIDLTSVDVESKRVTETSEITAETAPSRAQKLVEENDVIFATTRPAQQRYCLIDSELAGNVASTGYCVLRAKPDRALPKWILHWLSTKEFKSYVEENQSGAAYPSISDGKVKAFKIPIPCTNDPEKSLAIQQEIVRILDSFKEVTAKLTAELAAELAARKKQYSLYRDWLLSFEGGDVEWKTLDEIGEFIRGKRFTKADYVEDGIDVIHYGEIYTRFGVYASTTFSQVNRAMASSLRYAEPNDVIMTDVGETVDEVGKAMAWVGTYKVAIHDHCYAFRHQMNPKFIAYCMQTSEFVTKKYKYVAQTKVNTLLMRPFGKAEIPVPFPNDPAKSLVEQARIVAILDKFDRLTASLTEGLSREIELRKKQYAYYRDQLLSFPKPDAKVA